MDFSIPPPNYPPPQVQYSHNVQPQPYHWHPRAPVESMVQHQVTCATPGALIDTRFNIPPPPIHNQLRMQPIANQPPVPCHQPQGPPMMYPAMEQDIRPLLTNQNTACQSVNQSQQDIPDMRPQFLTNQFQLQPGQMVMLPPLTGDRSMQTIQILTPVHPGQMTPVPGQMPLIPAQMSPVHQPIPGQMTQVPGHNSYNVQTLVLPVLKVNNPLPLHPDLVVPQQDTGNIIQEEQEEVYLNKIDDTGLPQVMQGIDLDKVKQFAAEFKAVRIKLGLTQSQVGAALNSGQQDNDQISVSQSSICRFEKLEITALQVKKLLPVLQSWMAWALQRHAQGLPVINIEGLDIKEFKKRKRRTVFIKETVEALNLEFEANSNPSSFQLSEIADKLGLDKETTRVWFCNKRQQLKKCSENVDQNPM